MQLNTYIIRTCIALVLVAAAPVTRAHASEPWRLQPALGVPQWLSLSGTYRTRYETLNSQFRVGRDGSDQILVTRTTVLIAIHQGPLTIAGEMMDSRAALDDGGSPINTGLVNPVELLQAYLQWHSEDLFAPGARGELRVGRITLDVGSRRFVARNRFRNTINAFTGVDWQWQAADGRQLRAFFTLPVNRKPNTPANLHDNNIEFDEEDAEVKFWGLYYAATLSWGDYGELFYFGLDEDDAAGRPTANRDLTTIGFRLYRKSELAHFDYQIESAFQFGESRASPLRSNVTDLDHFAHFQHGEIGYSFAAPWRPRLIAQYDYASGDETPTDDDNDRFNTLFGARRFDFGPTSIYGPFARANINTPGLRLQLKPYPGVTGFIAYRGFWLASNRDAWTPSGVRDPSGDAGHFIGQQIEARVRWNVRPKNMRLEAGIAHLFAGPFMADAPNTNGQGDSTYVYSQVALWF